MTEYRRVEYSPGVEKVGVVADTHIPTRGRFLPPRLFRVLEGVQLILHAGDLVDEKVLDELGALAPVEAVAGNMDPPSLQQRLGRCKLVMVGGAAIGLLHGDIGGHRVNFSRVADLFRPDRPQAVVFGHLHEPVSKTEQGMLFFNPGSAVDPRRGPRPSCGLLYISGGTVSGEILYL